MNLLKRITLYTACLSGIVYLIGCNDLEEIAYSQAVPDQYFTAKNDISAALAGMYRPLQTGGSYGQARHFMLNSVSDEGNAIIFWGDYDQLSYGPATAGTEIADLWGTTFQSISAANFVLDNAGKIKGLTPSDTITNHHLAEARFIRAVNYFDLVQLFGGVPLRLTQAKRADDANVARNTEAEVYAQVVADFVFAEKNLPARAAFPGKPTRAAAAAFLAKVYLTQKDYPKALAQAKAVVNSGAFVLQSTFNAVFDVANENNSEVIFDIQFTRKDPLGMRLQYLFTGPDDKYARDSLGGWGLSFAEDGFFAKFAKIDERRATTFTSIDPKKTTYYGGKWRDVRGVSADGHENNFIVYRYGDLMLILAEAANEVNGPTAEAYAAINTIRSRAKLPALTGLTKETFRAAVLQERQYELAFEQMRWLDLKRTGTLKSTLTGTGRKWDDRYYLWPIPQTEIDASNGLVKQNPGY